MGTETLDEVYAALLDVMTTHASDLTLTNDKPGSTTVESQDLDAKGKPLWFGAVQTKQNYVSYHLMPVYEDPALLDNISAELKARMQGKSCFNFKKVDTDLFAELGVLTTIGATAFNA